MEISWLTTLLSLGNVPLLFLCSIPETPKEAHEMDHDYWGAIALFVLAVGMMLPSTIAKIRNNLTKRSTK